MQLPGHEGLQILDALFYAARADSEAFRLQQADYFHLATPGAPFTGWDSVSA